MESSGTSLTSRFGRLPESVLAIGSYPNETADRRGKRRIIVAAIALTTPVVVVVGIGRILFDHPVRGTTLLSQACVHLAILAALHLWPERFVLSMHILSGLDMTLITLGSMAMGGLIASGLNTLWAFASVVIALIALSRQAAAIWFALYAVAVILTQVGGDWLDTGERPHSYTVDVTINVIGASLLIFLVMIYFVRQREFFQRQSDDLLHNILPDSIATRLKAGSSRIADSYESATVLFADVVGFTPMSASMNPDELVTLLDDIFTSFDAVVERLGLEKIKTIGDEYMVAAGVPVPRQDHAHAMAEFALATCEIVTKRNFGGHQIELRIGINSGPVVAGIVGDAKFSYDLWGDTVNTASRLESHGLSGQIHISRATRDLISDDFACELRGNVELKGKGATETWWLRGRA